MSKKRKRANPFMEWLSDNLRYILLIIGVFAVLAGLFFGVRAISERLNPTSKASYSSAGVGSSGTASAEAPADAQSDSAAEESESAASLIVSSEPSPTEEAGSGHGTLALSEEPEVTRLIEDYYTAMSVQDLSQIQKITDILPEDQAAKISSSTVTYSDVKAYTKNGPDEDSRVVYAYYKYRNAGQSSAFPGLSQMLIRKGADDQWKIVYSDLDEADIAYIDSVTADQDVQDLITEVKSEYTAAREAAEKAESTSADAAEETAPADEGGDGSEDDADGSGAASDASGEDETGEEGSGEEGSGEDADEEAGEEENSGDETSSEAEEAPADGWTATINSSCNVREGAGYDYNVIGGVGAGTTVTVIGDLENGWWHIRTDEIEGYIGGRFID